MGRALPSVCLGRKESGHSGHIVGCAAFMRLRAGRGLVVRLPALPARRYGRIAIVIVCTFDSETVRAVTEVGTTGSGGFAADTGMGEGDARTGGATAPIKREADTLSRPTVHPPTSTNHNHDIQPARPPLLFQALGSTAASRSLSSLMPCLGPINPVIRLPPPPCMWRVPAPPGREDRERVFTVHLRPICALEVK